MTPSSDAFVASFVQFFEKSNENVFLSIANDNDVTREVQEKSSNEFDLTSI